MDIEFAKEITKIFFEKGILAFALLGTGYIITKSIEKIKSNEAFKNEMNKKRVERIAKFYDLFSEYEHWTNRIITNIYFQIETKGPYLTDKELKEAQEKSEAIENSIGYELNQMRFWINDDIYFHTVAQLELFKEMKMDLAVKGNFEAIKDYRLKLDTLRMNIDKLIAYLMANQNLKLVKYDRSWHYK